MIAYYHSHKCTPTIHLLIYMLHLSPAQLQAFKPTIHGHLCHKQVCSTHYPLLNCSHILACAHSSPLAQLHMPTSTMHSQLSRKQAHLLPTTSSLASICIHRSQTPTLLLTSMCTYHPLLAHSHTPMAHHQLSHKYPCPCLQVGQPTTYHGSSLASMHMHCSQTLTPLLTSAHLLPDCSQARTCLYCLPPACLQAYTPRSYACMLLLHITSF